MKRGILPRRRISAGRSQSFATKLVCDESTNRLSIVLNEEPPLSRNFGFPDDEFGRQFREEPSDGLDIGRLDWADGQAIHDLYRWRHFRPCRAAARRGPPWPTSRSNASLDRSLSLTDEPSGRILNEAVRQWHESPQAAVIN
jgi:hypothetical protein